MTIYDYIEIDGYKFPLIEDEDFKVFNIDFIKDEVIETKYYKDNELATYYDEYRNNKDNYIVDKKTVAYYSVKVLVKELNRDDFSFILKIDYEIFNCEYTDKEKYIINKITKFLDSNKATIVNTGRNTKPKAK